MGRLASLKPRIATLAGRVFAPPMTPAEAVKHQRVLYDKARSTDPIRKLYGTRRWRELRALLYAERGARCECGCGALTVLYEREATPTIHVAVFDHVEGARERPDLFWSVFYIKLLSKPCHDRKTAREQSFAAGRPGG